MSNNCPFCNIDKTKIYNTVLEKTKNFIVTPTLGSLVDGYIILVTKKHLHNMNELKTKTEYLILIEKYRNLFKEIYGKYPIVFEHGTFSFTKTSSSIVHAHTHIVKHNFIDEKEIIHKLNLKEIKDVTKENKSYILYYSPNNTKYISYNFEPTSQLMRLQIAKDLKIEGKYDWKKHCFTENVKKTINKINNKQKN